MNKRVLLRKYFQKYDFYFNVSNNTLYIYEPIFVDELNELHKCFKNIVVRSEK